jgi:thiamine-phosphate pyrophosphorylase
MKVDLRLYALLDPRRRGNSSLEDLAAQVVGGGATLLQLRDKMGATRATIDHARAIKAAIAGSGVPLLINDRVDIALAAEADGVHLGQDDMSAADARNLLGPDKIIGLSVKTIQEAAAAAVGFLDYACIGGVFDTMSKDNPNPPIGVDGLAEIAAVLRKRAPRLPIGAIAGIDDNNAASVMQTGVDGVAVISALSMANDPGLAARRLREIIDAYAPSESAR